MGHGHLDQVHSEKVARNELKMAPAVTKREIVHVVKFSAQSEQLRQSYGSNTGWVTVRTRLCFEIRQIRDHFA